MTVTNMPYIQQYTLVVRTAGTKKYTCISIYYKNMVPTEDIVYDKEDALALKKLLEPLLITHDWQIIV